MIDPASLSGGGGGGRRHGWADRAAERRPDQAEGEAGAS